MSEKTNTNCHYCDSCDYCYSCDSCYSCNYCHSCHYCNYCHSCDYCKNLKMTEDNLFCYSEEYNDDNSFQQKRDRAFNQVVGKERYFEILEQVATILSNFKPELHKNSWSEEWEKVTNDQWEQLLAIPEAKDFKEGFEFISGIEINIEEPKLITIKGKRYSEDTIHNALREYVK